jgi:fermentation-respiration switch protein FrsA (DUF1100 family)
LIQQALQIDIMTAPTSQPLALSKPPLKIALKILLIILGSLSGIYFALCIYLLVWQQRIIFKPTKGLEKFPQAYQLDHQEVWLPVQGKISLHGWWLPAPEPTRGVLLFLHGNAYNVGENLFHAKRFVSLGFSVLLMDYRGYGQSGGAFPHEGQVYEDAQAMYDYLTKEQGVSPSDILVYGHSLGGAIAIDLVQNNPVAGLIAESTFTSISDMANYTGQYDFLPVNLLLHQRFESRRKIAKIKTPTLFIHGTADETIPVAMGETLYETAIAPKQLLIVPDAGHNNVAKTAGDHYNNAVLDFYQLTRQHLAAQQIKAIDSGEPNHHVL